MQPISTALILIGGVTMVRNKLLLGIVLLLTMSFFILQTAYADEVIFTKDFEDGWGEWYADNGVWEVGEPSDPPGAHGEKKCAGTVLKGYYPNDTDSRLISALPHLPGLHLIKLNGDEVGEDEEIHLRFGHWFSFNWGDYGRVQISFRDKVTEDWSEFEDIPNSTIGYYSSSVWSPKDIDITAYKGKWVRITFFHIADGSYTDAGWYIDDVSVTVIQKTPELPYVERFEGDWRGWSAENGVWEIGIPSDPPGTHGDDGDEKCAGIVLNGNYPNDTDTRLISPSIKLDPVSGDEQIHLGFWHWFSFNWGDYGKVQISVHNEVAGDWSAWEDITNSIGYYYSSVWSPKDIDITAYENKWVRFAFYHIADGSYTGGGWYIDDVSVIKKTPEFTGDFEYGWADWSAENGVWEIGTPTSGPGVCHGQCARTVLNGNYPNDTDSRLITPSFWLLPCSGEGAVYMTFWHWWSYTSGDYGKVQISVQDQGTVEWSAWEDPPCIPGTIAGTSGVPSRGYCNLTAYAGQRVRIGFYHIADGSYTAPGWYIDDIEFPGISPVIDNISFTRYIPPPCISTITVTAHDPCEGDLTYHWDAPDGGNIIGTGAEVKFEPLGTGFDPCRVRVSVTSDLTHISSTTKTIKIYTEVVCDYDEDGDIDGSDLAKFAADPDDLARFAEEFGMVACQ